MTGVKVSGVHAARCAEDHVCADRRSAPLAIHVRDENVGTVVTHVDGADASM
jgi:hypothetical protein